MASSSMLLLLLLVGPGILAAAAEEEDDFDYTCFAGIYPSAGVTIPRGDINIEVGSDPFDIHCRLNPAHRYFADGFNASQMFFVVDGGDKLPSRIVNETTIVHTFDPNTMRKDQISCKIDLGGGEPVRGICHQYVFVGVKSIEPKDFQCISENWQNLNCTWTEPENPIKTSYSLSYIEPGRFGHQKHCPELLPGGKPMPRKTCFMSLRTTPPFRQPLEVYQFLMYTENALDRDEGGQYSKFPLNSFAVVRPGRVENLILSSPSPYSLDVEYEIPFQLTGFPPGLVSDIRYRSEFDSGSDWTEVDTSGFDLHEKEFKVTLEGLLPHAEYTVKVKLRSATANVTASPRLWSRVASAKVHTQQTLPAAAPLMTPGSFEIVGGLQERTVYVYWQRIDPTQKNGKDFKYSVTSVVEAGNVKPVNPVRVTSAYAEFPHLSLRNHSFYVASQNEIGDSVDASHVFVDHTDRLRGLQPRSFTKIAYNDHQFEVSWNPPEHHQLVDNYTVFWCRSENNRDRPYQCEGYLDWKVVPSDQRIVNITLPTNDIYQFAVSANAKERSSGMTWATCTILHNKVVGKLKTVSVDSVGKDSMKVRWRLDCSDRVGIVTGYKISYCPIESKEDTADCIGGEEFAVTTPETKDTVVLTDMKPWTYYKLGVSVLTRAGESEMSDYQVNRTRRDRPGSPPTNLRAELLTRNKLRAVWQAPDLPNGPIESYEIRTNYTDFKGDVVSNVVNVGATFLQRVNDRVDGGMFAIDVPELMFNAVYEVAVRACTVIPDIQAMKVCGEDWASVNVKTGIGKSGQMPEPLVTFRNRTEALVEWGHSGYHRGGPIKQFDLMITHTNLDLSKVIAVDGMYPDVLINLEKLGREQDWVPDCTNDSITNMYNFTIRAITFDPETEETFAGDWSPVEATPAYCQADTPWMIIIIVVLIVTIGGSIVAIYSCVFFSSTCSTLELIGQVNEKDKDAPIAASVIGGGGAHSAENGKNNWELPEHQLKRIKYQYQRNQSMDAKTTLLPDPKRNASGSSDTTSGCESSRSSETDEEEEIEMEVEKSFSSAGSSVSSGSTERRMRRRKDTEESELAPASPAGFHPYINCKSKGPFLSQPSGFNGQIPFADPKITNIVSPATFQDNPQGYSRFQASDIGAWPHQAQSPTSPTAGILPPGYSKVGVTSDPRMLLPGPHSQAPPPGSSGYVAFEQARNPNPMPATAAADGNTGYVTVAQAQQFGGGPAPPPPEDLPLPPRGYSKVGLMSPVGQLPPQPVSSGYVQQAAAMAPLRSPTGEEQQAMEDRLSSPALLSQMSEPLRQNPSPLQPLHGFPASPTSPLPDSPSSKTAMSPTLGSPSVGYVQAHNHLSPKRNSEAAAGDSEEEEAKSLVMSPKSLQVESKSPYSKVFTTVQNSKSSMV